MNISDKIQSVLFEHHILPNKKGYHYIKYIIEERLRNGDEDMVYLYNLASEKFGVKSNSVEKSIAILIERSFGYLDVAEKYGDFVNFNKGKLTNKQFISMVITSMKNRK